MKLVGFISVELSCLTVRQTVRRIIVKHSFRALASKSHNELLRSLLKKQTIYRFARKLDSKSNFETRIYSLFFAK